MKVLNVIGTRPEAIKMGPVVKELNKRPETFDVHVCLTAQHRELLDQVIEVFGIPVDYDLNLMSNNQTIFDVTCRVLMEMERILKEVVPDVVLVHGDTTTSFAAALAAYYMKIPVGHVEAGLRTYNKYQPFPEEINRVLGDALCTYHYAPTETARANLLKENIAESGIVVTGNTVIDALQDIAARNHTFQDERLAVIGRERRLILVTAHRRESFGEPLVQMCKAMRALVERHPDVELLYPVHPNPNVRKVVEDVLSGQERILLTDPLDYLTFVHVLKKAFIVLTDSGGIQEEAPSLGKPVLVMRDMTERPEAIAAGTAMLVGTSFDGIFNNVQRLLTDAQAYADMANSVNPYGDGLAAKRIADHLAALSSERDS